MSGTLHAPVDEHISCSGGVGVGAAVASIGGEHLSISPHELVSSATVHSESNGHGSAG